MSQAPQIKQLKPAPGLPPQSAADISDTVAIMLARLRTGREDAARDYARRLDRTDGPPEITPEALVTAQRRLPVTLVEDIAYAHANIRAFAEAQRASVTEFETELRPGLFAGQTLIPLGCAGAYVPGGRYAHIASALMSLTTARAAGVESVIACTPPGKDGPHPAILHAIHVAGVDRVLAMGGVQGIAAMALGLFDLPEADILVGPGNAFVAEAKRQLFGPIGIDMVAGPTDSMILADATASAQTVALDLVSQAEHGGNSPVWLVTTHRPLAEAVLREVPRIIATLPEPNRSAAAEAWAALGEVMLAENREAMAAQADLYAPEHLHVQAADPDWWRGRLRAYGSLFLGAETTVAFGDKAAGPNHVLPTGRAARYTGGLSVHKFLKCVTWQRVEDQALPDLAGASAGIARAEGMEGHARAAEARLPLGRARSPRAAAGA
ncbi:histidinol dehydrogenase [Salipiger bermudensis]|uniref:Histidinol dehydrogenase homolog n=1 Tax=Salipiger bermudensis (strain DSM 26914 / JCM 13377 / KCTC 12554 / HTCC2601) TaxID=314265 RepID=Q0FSY3_SALBH|nr:histidinol dehydrogenase [Salipiger bermudensis]EAU47386.1 histidinol dehydrogenase [Salipiger bermudensis HTCC2601]